MSPRICRHGHSGVATIFLYEYASAQAPSEPLPESIRIEGRAMFECLLHDFSQIQNAAVITLEGVTAENEQEYFAGAVRQADWTLLVAPESDGLLHERAKLVEELGGRLISCTSQAIAQTGDKWTAFQILKESCVRTPRTALASQEDLYRAWPLPWVCKPRDGAGSQEVAIIRDPSQVERAAGLTPAGVKPAARCFVVQQYVHGAAASMSFLVGQKGAVPLLPGYQLLSDDGHFHYQGGRIPLPTQLAGRAIALAQQAIESFPGLAGFVGVDLVLGDAIDGSQDYVIEINPRVTTSYVGLRALATDNLAEVWLRLAMGEMIQSVTWHSDTVHFEPNGTVVELPD